jgi:vacuolar-type H+-ATPase subunit I/STV1
LLQCELENIKSHLTQETQQHAQEQQDLLKLCKDTEMELSVLKQEHAVEVERTMMEISKLKTLLQTETLEQKELEKKCCLIETNKRIEQEEKRLLQQVVDMENQAEDILFRGAVALQKIIRGVQGRVIAKNMKKAKNKKKKGTKKKSGGGKNKKKKKSSIG